MQLATANGRVPIEVKRQQDESFKLLERIRRAWAPGNTYKPRFVAEVVRLTNQIIGRIDNKYAEALADTNVQNNMEIATLARGQQAFLQSIRRVLAGFAQKARDATGKDSVIVEPLRADIETILKIALGGWQKMNAAHDVYLSWMDGVTAAEIREDLRELTELVEQSPGAKKKLSPLAKITLSVGLTALVGGGTYLIWRHLNANANLNNHDGDEQEAQQIPVGIHHLLNAAGEGKIILDSARRLAKLAE